MDKKKLVVKIIETIICAAFIGWGVSIMVRHINDSHAFFFLLALLPLLIGFTPLLYIWIPEKYWPQGSNRVNTADDERRTERKEQRKAERDAFITAVMVDDYIQSKKPKKKENVWEDNSEDNDFDDEE